jgi:hypothetical protein
MARNARFTLTPGAVNLVSTGNVSPALDWQAQVPPGAPKPQRRDPDTGLPVWVVDALDRTDPTASRASVVSVEVSSMTEPQVREFEPLELSAVSVSLYVAKSGQLNVSYVGTLKSMTPAQNKPQAA